MTARLSTGRFYGDTLHRRRSNAIVLSEVRFPAGIRIPEHSHERPIFNFVLAGAYTECWGRQRTECRALRLLFHPAGLVHSERFSSAGARCLTVEFDPRYLACGDRELLPGNNAILPAEEWRWLSTQLRRELYTGGDDLTALALEGLLFVLLSGAARQVRTAAGAEAPLFVRRAHELLHDRFREPLRIGEVAEDVGVHPSSLARAFLRHYRCTPSDFVRGLRIDLASRLLADDDELSLAAIARQTGFSDQSHFSRTFKRLTGMTPGTFRALVSPN